MDLVSAGIVHPDPIGTTADGKVIRGGYSRTGFDTFPASIPKVEVLLRVAAAGEDEYGNHRLHIHFQDADGKQIGAALDKAFVFTPDLPRVEVHAPYADLAIPRPGAFSFEIHIDGEHVRSLPLEVTLGPPPRNVGHAASAAADATCSLADLEEPEETRKQEGPWHATLSTDRDPCAVGPILITLVAPRTDREVGLLVNAELRSFKDVCAPAPGVEVKDEMVMAGGAYIPSLKLGDASKQRVGAGDASFDITLLSAMPLPPKPGQVGSDFQYEVLVSRGD